MVAANLGVLAAAIAVPTRLAVTDEAAGRVCLGWLAPLFDGVVAISRALQPCAIPSAYVPVAAAAAAAVYVLLRSSRWSNAGDTLGSRSARLAPYGEALLLAVLTLAVAAYRFYALNRVLHDNVGEMTFSVIAASDLDSLLKVNVGAVNAPWAPLGAVYYFLVGALLPFCGSTILTMRIAAAVTSVLLTQVLYGFVRLLGGPLAAIIATVWYVSSPVEMAWGRHDMFPFNSASPVVLALAVSTYLAITRFRRRYWVATAVLMGLTAQLFASGFAGFLLPVGVLAWLAVFDRARLRRCGGEVLWVAAGAALWAASRSLAYLAAYGSWQWLNPFDARLEGRVLRGSGWGAWDSLLTNLDYVARRLYVGVPADVHQTPLGAFTSNPVAYIDPLVAIFFTVGLAWLLLNPRRPVCPVLLGLLGASLLPGITSIAAAHRMAVAFPAISAIAALPAAQGLRALPRRLGSAGVWLQVIIPLLVLPAMFLRIGGAYFSQASDEPPNVTVYKSVEPFLRPGTIVVVDFPVTLSIDVVYQMFDRLRVEPLSFVMPEGDHWNALVEHPEPQLDHLFYRWTALRYRVPELREMRWRHVVFLLHPETDGAHKLELLRAKYPHLEVTEVRPPTWRPGYDFTVVAIDLDGAG
ncbi:MAG: ArnT family glycosyltransferase [Candidatus Binatia bacterium]